MDEYEEWSTEEITIQMDSLRKERNKLSTLINEIDDKFIGLREELFKRKELAKQNLLNGIPEE